MQWDGKLSHPKALTNAPRSRVSGIALGLCA